MKELTMFYLDDCGYCARARKALDELYAANPTYREVQIQYDYYAVPTFFDGDKKLFEAHLFMSYEAIRDEVKRVLDYALKA